MSVSVAETDGKSFENPAYEAGERPAGPTTGAAAAAPDVSDKVGRPKSRSLVELRFCSDQLSCMVAAYIRHAACIFRLNLL